jgi:hypothetical protein
MGKQGKSKTNGSKPRSAPYPKKATVDVRFEGDAPAPAPAPAPAIAASVKSASKPKPKTNTTAPAPAPQSEKAKGKQKALPATTLPGSFILIAGSYEKLLYGIEGSYPPHNIDSGDGLVNRVVKPDLTPIFIFPAHLAFVKCVAASPGGKWLATGSEDEFIKVWDLRRRKEVGSLSQHTGMSLLFVFCPVLRGGRLIGRINHFITFPYVLAFIVYFGRWDYFAFQDIGLESTEELERTFRTSQLGRRASHRPSRFECRKGSDTQNVGSDEGTRCR